MPPLAATDLPAWFPVAITLLALWTIPWKGLALWRAARKSDKVWFIILLLVNTVGILEIIYLLVTREKKPIAPERSA